MRIDTIIKKIGVSSATLTARKAGSAPPPILQGAIRFPYGPFQFSAQLPKGSAYEVQASNDLKLWNSIAQGIAKDFTIEVLDSLATNYNHRFYRVIANDVPSSNVVGYASITVPPRFSMITNPFDSGSNTIGELFKDWPDNTTLNRFDTRLFRLMDNMVKNGRWTNPSDRLLPGHGAIFFNPTTDYKPLDFAGEVMQGNLSIPIPSGFSIRGSIVPADRPLGGRP